MEIRLGTIEEVAARIGAAFVRLGDLLERDNAIAFFNDMGLLFPGDLYDIIGTELDDASELSYIISNKLLELFRVSREKDYIELTQVGVDLIEAICDFYTSLGEIETSFGNVTSTNLSEWDIPESAFDVFKNNLRETIVAFVLTRQVQSRSPLFANILSLASVLDRKPVEGDPNYPDTVPTHVSYTLNMENIVELFEPWKLFGTLFNWKKDEEFNGELIPQLAGMLQIARIPTKFDPWPGPYPLIAGIEAIQTPGFEIRGIPEGNPTAIQLTWHRPVKSGMGLSVPIGGGWFFNVTTEMIGNTRGAIVKIEPPFNLVVTPPDSSSIEGEITVGVDKTYDEPLVLLGVVDGPRLEVKTIKADIGIGLDWEDDKATGELVGEVACEGGKLVLMGGDGFISSLMPSGGLEVDFDLGLGLSSSNGIYLKGSAALEISFGVNIDLGPLHIDTIRLGIMPKDNLLSLRPNLDFGLNFGPAKLSLDEIGIKTNFDFSGEGEPNLGLFDLDVGFKPPAGIGIALDLGPAKGGGYLYVNEEDDSYAGLVELSIAEMFELQVIGLVSALPSGDFSVLCIGSVQFMPPIQLFMGFGLGGVGVLVGIHRAMNSDQLRKGVKEGNLDAVLFPDNPAENPRRIVDSLTKFFPPTQDSYVFGALGMLVWGAGGMFELKVGVALEIPDHIKLMIAAILDIQLPPGGGIILKLRADVLGLWDSDTGMVSVDGTLRDSKVANAYTISGDVVFLNKSTKGFIFSAGGFHPAFNPPADLAEVERLAISFGSKSSPSIRVEGYFALTSNSIQAGARAELKACAAGFCLEGWMSVDMLFEVDPFRVRFDFSAGVKIKAGSSTIMSLTLKASFDGFSPTKIKGKVSFSLIFFSVSIPVSLTYGKKKEKKFKEVDVLPELIAAVEDKQSWSTDIEQADTQGVTLREPAVQDAGENDSLLIHPMAPFSFRQQVVPLKTEIETFKRARPMDEKEFYVKKIIIEVEGGEDEEWITEGTDFSYVDGDMAPGQYFELDHDEQLSRPSFEPMPVGVFAKKTTNIDIGDVYNDISSRNMEYESEIWDKKSDQVIALERYRMRAKFLFILLILSCLAQKQRKLKAKRFVPKAQRVTLKPQKYVVAKREANQVVQCEEITPQPTSYAQAMSALKKYRRKNSNLFSFISFNWNNYHVVGEHELTEAA